jgi:meiotically up-regulated gene 157 (Mug157) protein
MIVQDPYANSYFLRWRKTSELKKDERVLGRGGWVSTRNYELDSGAYFIHLLWNLFSLPGYGRSVLLLEPGIFEAASLLVDVWTTELWHEERSSYRYSELPREGRGPASNYTGEIMVSLHAHPLRRACAKRPYCLRCRHELERVPS